MDKVLLILSADRDEMHNLAQGLPAVVRDPETKEVVWSLFRN